MNSQARPTSELFINGNANVVNHTFASSSMDKDTAVLPIQSHPSVLKPRRRLARVSRIPVRTVAEGSEDDLPALPRNTPLGVDSTADTPYIDRKPSMLDIFLLGEAQTPAATLKIDDLYNTASLIVPPYLVKQLAQLEVMDEDGWMTKFPEDVSVDRKIRAVQSLLIELGLVVARLSEIVRRERTTEEEEGEEVD